MNRNRRYNPYNPMSNNNSYQSLRNQNINNNIVNMIHDLIMLYNDNIRHHNQIIEEYNHNIYILCNILQNIISQNSNASNINYPSREHFPQNTTAQSTNRRNFDLSSLFYLLNIPIHGNYEQNRYIPLSQEQINSSTAITTYDNHIHNEIRCPISLDDFVSGEEICQIQGCGHYFKKNHIMRWFQNNHLCPVCRYNVRNNRPQPTTDNATNNTSTTQINTEQPIHEQQMEQTNSDENETEENMQNSPSGTYQTNLNNLFFDSLDSTIHNYTPRNTSQMSRTNMNQFSRLITDIILEQMPNIDASNNLMYTFELPFLPPN